jgi:hypothetical protein
MAYDVTTMEPVFEFNIKSFETKGESTMKRFIMSLGAMAVGFGAMCSPVLAASGRGGGGHAAATHSSARTVVHSTAVVHTTAVVRAPAVVHSAAVVHAPTVVHASAAIHTSAAVHSSAGVHTGNAGFHADFHGLHYGPGGYLHRDYRSWSRWYWNPTFGCYWYFCPDAACYYYWYAPGDCYLPATQAAMYPPTPGTLDNNIINGVTPGMPAPMPMPLPQ